MCYTTSPLNASLAEVLIVGLGALLIGLLLGVAATLSRWGTGRACAPWVLAFGAACGSVLALLVASVPVGVTTQDVALFALRGGSEHFLAAGVVGCLLAGFMWARAHGEGRSSAGEWLALAIASVPVCAAVAALSLGEPLASSTAAGLAAATLIALLGTLRSGGRPSYPRHRSEPQACVLLVILVMGGLLFALRGAVQVLDLTSRTAVVLLALAHVPVCVIALLGALATARGSLRTGLALGIGMLIGLVQAPALLLLLALPAQHTTVGIYAALSIGWVLPAMVEAAQGGYRPRQREAGGLLASAALLAWSVA